MRCSIGKSLLDDENYQPFPCRGKLAGNLNLTRDEVSHRVDSDNSTIYCYIVDTIKIKGEYFIQTGSGPNFQGDMITLCTCKHRMRSFMDVNDWKEKWIAGFSGLKAGGDRNALVYLMKVGPAFESHRDLWYSTDIPDKTKQAKAANTNRFGDLFPPKRKSIDPFSFGDYHSPTRNPVHVHLKSNKWHKDICYVGCSHRPSALLVGEPNLSFVWNRPLLCFQNRLHRGQKKLKLQEMLSQLEDDNLL